MRHALILALLGLISTSPAIALEPIFAPMKIDGPVHDPANGTFWYEAPDWIRHEGHRSGANTRGEFVNNCGEVVVDVNRDGFPDLVSAGWFENGVFWYENPGAAGGQWQETKIIASDRTEGLIAGDIDGDGDTDILMNHWTPGEGQGVTWLELEDDRPAYTPHVIGTEGDRHGCGLGDINGDSRVDIITPDGWYAGPRNPLTDDWTFHPAFDIPHESSIPLPVFDVNGDGRADVIYGQGHTYGFGWYEQLANGSWDHHLVEDSLGQFHTFTLADIDGDGDTDLITGKRLRGHNGSDTSSHDPLFLLWYEFAGGKFVRHPISFNHLPWYPNMAFDNPAPNYAVGAGMNINVADVTGDGLPDIVCAGKSGLYIMINRGMPPTEPLEPRGR